MKHLGDLTDAVLRFAREREWGQFHNPKNLAMAVAVEASELQEIFMWLTPEQSAHLTDEQRAKAEDEVGDVMICLANFAARTGIDLLGAAAKKMKKNHEKYPVDKSRGSAKKYDEL